MTTRLNAPHPQTGPLLFVGLCLAGSFIVIGGTATLPVGSEPWLAGVLMQSIIVAGLLVIIGAWLWIQREITVGPGAINVRRWIQVLRGQPGTSIEVRPGTEVAITLEGARSLVVRQGGEPVLSLPLSFWDPIDERRLIDTLRETGIRLSQYWEGMYPHDLA